jgi:hypothetical protein
MIKVDVKVKDDKYLGMERVGLTFYSQLYVIHLFFLKLNMYYYWTD